MSANTVFINDTFIAADKASLLITDLSIQRGYGIFDFFKTIGNRPIFLEDHLDRFYQSAQKMHLEVSQTRAELKAILAELMERNEIPDSGIRMTLTGGYSSDGYLLTSRPNLIIAQQPLTLSMELDQQGLSLMTYNYQRQLAESKTIDYSMAIWLQPFIKSNGADDVLYHHEGMLREVPRANFFIVNADNEVITAKSNVLKGITRKHILSLADSGFSIIERDFNLEELAAASEAFITSTTKHIFPVTKIDGVAIGDGQPGKVSATLLELLVAKLKQH